MAKAKKAAVKKLPAGYSRSEFSRFTKTVKDSNIQPTVAIEKLAASVHKLNPQSFLPEKQMPEDVRSSLKAMKNKVRRFHGAKFAPGWFPPRWFNSPCADKFGYLTSKQVRQSSALDFNPVNVTLMNQLGEIMGNAGRDIGGDSPIPAGYTYFGQFVDHDITLDVSSNIDTATDANFINNMRTPSLELDNLYGRGPALEPFLYEFPSSGPLTAIKFKLGSNTPDQTGGPSTQGGGSAGMRIQTNFDVPRMNGNNTAVIGDPRNDENIFVSQFHMAMLKFHNAVIDLLIVAGTPGDLFVEAKKIVTHHYQWAVIHDFLKQICGATTVDNSLSSVTAPVNSGFRMPVEFSVAAFRFGHSLVRGSYWVNHRFIAQPLLEAFTFIRNPNLPVKSGRVVDFNAFFRTGIGVPVFNSARKIDTVLTSGLEALPGESGIMSILASRNLRRGLAFGLPSGQATATALGIAALSPAELTSSLPADELNVLQSNGGILLQKTPLWYYILREAAVKSNGDKLGPLGAKIVADTFVMMLKRDPNSYWNKTGGFTPFLPSKVAGEFTVTDLIIFSGVNVPVLP